MATRTVYLKDVPLNEAWRSFRSALEGVNRWEAGEGETVPLDEALGHHAIEPLPHSGRRDAGRFRHLRNAKRVVLPQQIDDRPIRGFTYCCHGAISCRRHVSRFHYSILQFITFLTTQYLKKAAGFQIMT